MTESIAVLGAGVVGLSTALNIQLLYPGANVTIIADKFNTDTTSDGAAGVFRPTLGKTSGDELTLRKWCKVSFEWFHKIWMTDEAAKAGIHRVGGYLIGQEDCYKDVPLFCYHERTLSKEELSSFPGNPKFGYFSDTLMIECRRYLPWLLDRFYKKGGETRTEKIESLSQIAGQYDIYVNCLGLSSREIFGDKEMYSVRGHLIRVQAPWVKNIYMANSKTYIYPGQDEVVLGGTRQKGVESLEHDDENFRDVFQRCCEILPALKHAPIIRKWIGLRPHRTSVRLEKEMIKVDKQIMKVIHNVGHGGDGVALSWGSAVDAAYLVKHIIEGETSSNISKSKL